MELTASVLSAFGWAQKLFTKSPLPPLIFDNPNFETLPASQKFEEEILSDNSMDRYYPVLIGEVLDARYQVVGKLGFGLGSTVWLARDLQTHDTVALKVSTHDRQNCEETNIYKHLMSIKSHHPGRNYLRNLTDTFTLQGPHGVHQCLVHEPMWESMQDLLKRNPSGKFTEQLLKALLRYLLHGLDYLHTEAHLIHTDISPTNILIRIVDPTILTAFIQAEQEQPFPRKEPVDGYTVYASRGLSRPSRFGEPLLSDFGSAVFGNVEHTEQVQPDFYRAPEVCLRMPWSYSIDIWNVAVLAWDLFEGKDMFDGWDPIEKTYTTRGHLAQMVALMGPPPLDFLQQGKRTSEFFNEDGTWRGEIPIPDPVNLEHIEENLEGSNKEAFLRFMRKMLQWRPEDRQTAKQLLQDSWLNMPTVP